MKSENKKYLIVLLITAGIFVVVFGLVSVINQNRLENIDDLQRKITADLIATETQFDLLRTAPCSSIENTILSEELNELGRKLDFTQDNQGVDNPDVIQLKKYYSLLQVKDYLLMQEFSEKCGTDISSILYFYNGNCQDCGKQALVLNEFKRQYPKARIYSFDANLEFSVIDTFISLYDFGEVYPALIIKDEAYQGFQDLNTITELLPALVEEQKEKELRDMIIKFIKDGLNTDNDIEIEKVSEQLYTFEYNEESGAVSIDDDGEYNFVFEEIGKE